MVPVYFSLARLLFTVKVSSVQEKVSPAQVVEKPSEVSVVIATRAVLICKVLTAYVVMRVLTRLITSKRTIVVSKALAITTSSFNDRRRSTFGITGEAPSVEVTNAVAVSSSAVRMVRKSKQHIPVVDDVKGMVVVARAIAVPKAVGSVAIRTLVEREMFMVI